jgi:hypothetical protein
MLTHLYQISVYVSVQLSVCSELLLGFQQGENVCFPVLKARRGSGSRPLNGTANSSVIKVLEHEADHSPQDSAVIKASCHLQPVRIWLLLISVFWVYYVFQQNRINHSVHIDASLDFKYFLFRG